ncbi:NAD(P)-dependent oxidoreductase [Flavobacterium pallidum]|nr:NAD(P)-dependent oxidoreductase [Flavobacterium pallidum]
MKILITESENFSAEALRILSEKFEVHQKDLHTVAALGECIADYDVLFIRLRFKIDKAILSKAPKLRFILTATTGLDHVDTDFFEANGGTIISLKGQSDFLNTIPSTAEHTWALLMALIKRIPSSFNDVKTGNWNRDAFKGHNLKGMKLGILGLGRVGSQVANYANAFGMAVSYYDLAVKSCTVNSFKDPELLFSWADAVCIHIPGDVKNQLYLNHKLLACCKPGAILVNTSRGNVWDENEVARLLTAGHLSGVATDVLSDEYSRINLNPLVKLAIDNQNIIITPHIAGATFESMQMTENFIAENFIKQLS